MTLHAIITAMIVWAALYVDRRYVRNHPRLGPSSHGRKGGRR